MSPTDTSPGPRIGMAYDKDYYGHFVEHGHYPPLDNNNADSNSGVFLIKPGDSLKPRFTEPRLMFRPGGVPVSTESEEC